MPRGPRIAFENAFYHVFNRGVAKMPIFRANEDYHYFLHVLSKLKIKKQFDHDIYAYVLMPNHFHLLIQTKKIPISKIMSSLLTSYSMYFNRKYHRVGILFQNRFKSKLCDRDTYFLGASRYIFLNPVAAGIVKRPEDYLWSGYRELLGKSSMSIITPDASRLIGESDRERNSYRRFIEDSMGQFGALEREFTFERDIAGHPLFNSLSQKKYLRRKSRQTA